ncbi:MAG: hydrogenase maturation nickel metallochaperone HypA [Thermodesulfobacteriota bacterium]
MHEMSLAMNIVELAVGKAREAGAQRIDAIELEVGALAGVMVEALTFCLEAASRDTMASGARFGVAVIAGWARCLECGDEFGVKALASPCPRCGNYATELVRGRELRVSSLLVDEE